MGNGKRYVSITAIILAAGKGTRMKSDLPKVLHKVCGRPMLAYVIDVCRAAGCDRLLIVIGHEADTVRRTFAGEQDLVWVEQSRQLGTGHAVMVCAEHLRRLSGPVLVVAGDGPLIRPETLRKLLETHAAEDADCTLATSILPDPGRYGRIVRNRRGELEKIVEYLDADEQQRRIKEVNVSLYCFEAQSLCSVLDKLDNKNAKGEYYLTDAVGLLKAAGAKLAAVAAVPPEDVLSINTCEELEQVDRIMAARLADSGVRK
jgi:UDP-N-acetylglucosamine diphosphorylase/glucosamine-1-phosphate N-acetyltransferase